MDKLLELLQRCEYSVTVSINVHKDLYQTIEEAVDELYCCGNDPRLEEATKEEILRTGNMVRVLFFPDTPHGSYDIIHYDLESALSEALSRLD